MFEHKIIIIVLCFLQLQKWRGWCNVPYYAESSYHTGRLGQPVGNGEVAEPFMNIPQLESGLKKVR
jgi:hypothetical protein